MRCLICGDDAWMISKTGNDVACDCNRCGLYRAEGSWFHASTLSVPADDLRAFLQLQREESPDDTPVINSASATALFALSQLSTSQMT